MSLATATLAELCRPKQWKTLSKKEMLPEGVTVFGANGPIGFTNTFTHEDDTILVGCRGSCGTLHVMPRRSYANGNAMALGELRHDRVDLQYLYRVLEARGFDDVITGSSQPQIIRSNIERIEIPLPPLEEQRRIAAILDQADALCRLRRRALDRLNTLGQAIFHEMFGDIVTNSEGFETVPLTDALNFKTGKLDSNAAVKGGQYPFFTCAKEVSEIDVFAFDCEALLLAGNNANADYDVKYYNGKFNAYQRTYVLTISDKWLRYTFVKSALETLLGELKRFSKGSNTKYLTMEIFRRMKLPVPDHSLQLEFEARQKSLSFAKIKIEKDAAKVEMLFASLQHRAFRGEF